MVNMSVRKSPNDRKLYRVVKLDNGLVALLIEDHVGEDRAKKRSDSSMGQTSTSESSYEGSDLSTDFLEVSGDSTGGSGDESSSGDNVAGGSKVGKGRGKKKADVGGIKKKKRTSQGDLDTEDLSSACALCVNVGSFCDPPDVPGMAHLLEHMVFMGSDKYPGENALDVLTNRYGGYDNASTDYERTTFTLTIHNKHLKKALDMFAHFFASPQLLQGCLDREIEAVDSEFQTSIQKDPIRLQQLLCTLARPDHPYSKFVWGNAKSLKEDLKESNIDLRARLREFYSRWYSSHYMTLVVHSSDSLGVLEEWVRQSFSAIPRNDLPSPEYPDDPPFDRRSFNKLIKVVPVKNTQEVHLTWVLPSLLKYYRTKPLAYLGWLLGHEGKGSILSYLKKRDLATSIEAGNCRTGYEYNSCFSLFYCCITLTDKGFANVDHCILAVFQYLKMLQVIGPQERVFQELQIIEENDFNYQEDPEPADYVETLCESMQLYPEEEYLTGEELFTEYNPECIAMVTNLLTPDRVNVMWLSKSFSDECVMEEKWFGIKYSSHDLPRNWINGAFAGNPELALPIENIYIATDFSLIDVFFPSDFPMLVEKSDHHKLWYKPDNVYENHKAWVGLVFDTPIHMESAQNAVLIDLFMSLFSYVTSELTYEADIAGLEYSLESCRRGLALTVNGFSHKFPMFFKALIDELVKFSSASAGGYFQVIKEQLKREYHNYLLRPKKLCKSHRLKILEDIHWNALDRMEVVDNVTLAQLHDVMVRMKRSVYIEALMQGNLEKEVAFGLMKYVSDSFNFHGSRLPTIISPRTLQFPFNTEISLCIPNRDPASPNTVITDYYQCCLRTERDRVMCELVVTFMEEPCFDLLRTKKQLGYEVSCDWHLTHGVVGLSVNIITQTKKHSASYVSKCMEKFVQTFSTTFSSRKKSEFDAQVRSFIQDKLEPDFILDTEVSRNWKEIINQWYQFDRLQKDVEIVKTFSQEEVGDWLRRFTLPGKNHRKLTIQVVSRDGADCATADQGSHDGKVHLTPNSLANFKRQLYLYPSV